MTNRARRRGKIRSTGIRAQLLINLLGIFILLLLSIVFNYILGARLDQTLARAEEEMRRVNAALKAGKASPDLLSAISQAALIKDPVIFNEEVDAAQSLLLEAETQLSQSAALLPADDPVRAVLDELQENTMGIRDLADEVRTQVEQKDWQYADLAVGSMLPIHQVLVSQSINQLQELTDARLEAADRDAQTARWMIQIIPPATGLLILATASGSALLLIRRIAYPIKRLTDAADRLASGHLEERVPLVRITEFSHLASTFNYMAEQMQSSYEDIGTKVQERTEELGQAYEKVRLQSEQQNRLIETIRQMSVPVIPVLKGAVVMPLVGSIDSERADMITEALLAGVQEHNARVAILDITGIPVVDTAVANALIQAIRATALLGVKSMLVGISPEVAQTIVQLGVDLGQITTRSTLQSAIEYATRLL